MKSIYVGNLPFAFKDGDLAGLFSDYTVSSAKIVMDRDTGRSKGFGFVEMEDDAEALAAVEALNGTEVNGRALRVNEAQPREPRRPPFRGGDRGNRRF
ncbi:MAG: RNA-binding protein [Fibrobacter sp.]|jgi:RNA recognition motif-containing protein|nr:RNA-binding protein [Fibrobacter sp.]